jgi:hypothetical protein
MDLTQSLNLNTATQKPLFNPTYLNLEYIFQKILDFFNITGTGSLGLFFRILFFIIILFLLFMIAYCIVRIFEIRKKEKEHLEHEIKEYARKQKEKEEKLSNPDGTVNPKWQSILTHVFSPNEAEWKIAIIEADTMLEELMDQLGFKGENLGEKLKSADQEKFKYLTSAWEAHTLRNRIAHEGSNFELTQREAKRVVTLYEQIFTEFGFI